MSDTELSPEYEFELHEGHAFGNDGEGDEAVGKEFSQVVDGGIIDLVDAEGEAMSSVRGDELAFVGVDLLDDVMQLFEEVFIRHLGAGAGDGIAGEPASLVVRVENLEVAAFDLDNQPELFGEL